MVKQFNFGTYRYTRLIGKYKTMVILPATTAGGLITPAKRGKGVKRISNTQAHSAATGVRLCQ